MYSSNISYLASKTNTWNVNIKLEGMRWLTSLGMALHISDWRWERLYFLSQKLCHGYKLPKYYEGTINTHPFLGNIFQLFRIESLFLRTQNAFLGRLCAKNFQFLKRIFLEVLYENNKLWENKNWLWIPKWCLYKKMDLRTLDNKR